MFELMSLLLTSVVAWVRPRQDLVLENLLVGFRPQSLVMPVASIETTEAIPD
jgi:hypothetical protein